MIQELIVLINVLQFSAYPDLSPSKVIRISGVLLFQFTAKISLFSHLVNTLLFLSYSEDTSGDFSCNISQYCVHGRTGFYKLYRHEPAWIISDDDGGDVNKNNHDNAI